MLRTNWRSPRGGRKAPNTGAGKVKRSRVTGAHKFMLRTDREALCRKLEGGQSWRFS